MLCLIWFQNLIKMLIINMLIGDSNHLNDSGSVLYHCDTDEIRNLNDNFERFFEYNGTIYFVFKNRIIFIDDIYFGKKFSNNSNKDYYFFLIGYLFEFDTKQAKQKENLKNLKTIGYRYYYYDLEMLRNISEIFIDEQANSSELAYEKATLKFQGLPGELDSLNRYLKKILIGYSNLN